MHYALIIKSWKFPLQFFKFFSFLPFSMSVRDSDDIKDSNTKKNVRFLIFKTDKIQCMHINLISSGVDDGE